MRNNQPVTGREFAFPRGKTLISYTNLKGQITHLNVPFIEISGYSKDELIGQPHNIVRHPDMPPEAFRDMWETIKSGRPWSGLVKNRRKDGDHYWVRAYVSPLADGTGYVSVRVEPNRQEINGAEQLYARMQHDTHLRLDEGQPVSGGAWARLMRGFSQMRIATRLWILGLTGVFGYVFAVLAKLAEIQEQTRIEVAIAGSIFMLIQSWIVIGKIRHGLLESKAAAEAIAAGDLTKPLPVPSKDELGDVNAALSVMRNNLHELIASVRDGIVSINQRSEDVSASAHSSLKVTEMQSEAASGMAAAMEQLSVSIDQVSEHANDAYRVSKSSSEQATEGGKVIQSAATEMEHIATAVNDVAGTIRGLEEYSAQISSIVNVIREIADQTNLLALNAAIEAARAGEQGRGFAVVADEVRKLAERTATSTKEITGMISKIQDGTKQAVHEMEISVKRVSDGVGLARQAGNFVSNISDAAQHAAQAVNDISHAIREQSLAARDIAQRIEKIAQGTEENTLAAGQTATSAKMLADLSKELNELAARFRIA